MIYNSHCVLAVERHTDNIIIRENTGNIIIRVLVSVPFSAREVLLKIVEVRSDRISEKYETLT